MYLPSWKLHGQDIRNSIKNSHDDYDDDIESRSSQKCSMHMLSASWGNDYEDIGYISKSEWYKLKNHFSHSRIIGIKCLSSTEDRSNDLIMFDI